MQEKQDILEAIRRTAKENGGVPLGMARFSKQTGINVYECSKFWPNFSEAQQEAGFEPNTLSVPHSVEFLKDSLITLMRELGRFPTPADIIGKRHRDSSFPSPTSIRRLGNKKEKIEKILEYSRKRGFNDITELCEKVASSFKENDYSRDLDRNLKLGEVYLFKSGRYYKIGKTNDTVRRGNELRIQLPENLNLIHSIKTDDPSGIEAYWHKRFEAKRMKGEWFDLSSVDIKAFKRWRRII